MLTLLIDTSTERGIVSILKDNILLCCEELPFGYNNSKFVIPTIERCLHSTGFDLKQLSMIAVGIGPGSYTGIRVGTIVAKSLAYATKIPLLGVCSLEGYVPSHNCQFAAMIDAKIGGAYLLKGIKNDAGVRFLSAPEVYPLEALAAQLTDIKVIVTPYSALLRPKIDKLYPNATWEWEERSPCANQMAASALAKFKNGEVSQGGQLELLYLRKTQAELEKEKRDNQIEI